MDCPIRTQQNREWLLDYAAGRLGGEPARVVAAHLVECRSCAEFVEGQQAVWNALSQWEPEAISADFNRRLYGAIDRTKPASWIGRIFGPLEPVLWRPAFPLVAACLMLAAGVVLRMPNLSVTPIESQVRAEKIELDQVERNLDDLQMLRELELTPKVPQTGSETM